jgi:F420-non-reducing hydrogenase small subunit
MVSFGSCACEGCIPGLANFSSITDMVDTAFSTITTDNPDNIRPQTSYAMPEGIITIPTLNPILKTLDQVVDVDYYMPGCPPESHQIAAVVDLVIAALNGKAELPPKGATIGAGDSTVCDECPRTRNVKAIKEFGRIQLMHADPEPCACSNRASPATARPPAAAAMPAAPRLAPSASAATVPPKAWWITVPA